MTKFCIDIKRIQKENGLFDLEILFIDGTKGIISDCKPIMILPKNDLGSEKETYIIKAISNVGEIELIGCIE